MEAASFGHMDRDLELKVVARLRRGDTAAFDEVYEAWNGRLYNFLARLSGRREVAEDLLEETWLRLVKHAPRLRPDTSLGAWLVTVARRLHASHCRSRLLEDGHHVTLFGLWPHGRPEPTPFDSAAAGEEIRHVAAALATLPLHYREALLLVAIEELAHSEAAAICGVTTEAMRQRVTRGRALLAERLSGAGTPRLRALKAITT